MQKFLHDPYEAIAPIMVDTSHYIETSLLIIHMT